MPGACLSCGIAGRRAAGAEGLSWGVGSAAAFPCLSGHLLDSSPVSTAAWGAGLGLASPLFFSLSPWQREPVSCDRTALPGRNSLGRPLGGRSREGPLIFEEEKGWFCVFRNVGFCAEVLRSFLELTVVFIGWGSATLSELKDI